MDDLCSYQIEVRGHVSEIELNRMSPIHVAMERGDPAATRLLVQADQSGLIGLMRHLHALGFVFLSMSRQERDDDRSAPCLS
ncbi:MAG: hypothetical protein ACK2U9_06375 [Anaerolineae bacterium]|jgi:hypothetical protein